MTDRNHIVYLALGDSYTIGTGASHESRNFPSLLAAKLQEAGGREVEVVNPAVNGFTTIAVTLLESPAPFRSMSNAKAARETSNGRRMPSIRLGSGFSARSGWPFKYFAVLTASRRRGGSAGGTGEVSGSRVSVSTCAFWGAAGAAIVRARRGGSSAVFPCHGEHSLTEEADRPRRAIVRAARSLPARS